MIFGDVFFGSLEPWRLVGKDVGLVFPLFFFFFQSN